MQTFTDIIGTDFNKATIWTIVLYALIIGIAGRNRPRILSTIPGFCASVGLLFTFIVLYDKLKGFEVPEGDIKVLETLVRQLSAAFSTSIIGVSGSLITNIFVKLRIDYIENKGYKTKPYLKQHPHELLHEIKTTNEASFSSLETALTTEFNKLRGAGDSGNLANVYQSLSTLTGKTIDRLDKLFDDLHTKLDGTITALGTNALENTQETITAVNTTFTEQTASLLQQNLEQLTQFFATHKEELQQTAQQFTEQRSGMQSRLETFEESFEEKMEGVQGAFASSVTEIGQKFNAEGAAIQTNLTAILTQMTQELQGVKSAFTTSTNQMAEDYGTQAQDLKATFTAIKTTLDQLNDDIQNRVKQILQGNLDTLETSFKRIADLQLTSQNNLQQTTMQFAGAVDQYQALSGNQEAILAQLGEQLSDFSELRDQLRSMQGGWQEFSDQVQLMENRVADIGNTIAQLHHIHEYFQKSNGKPA